MVLICNLGPPALGVFLAIRKYEEVRMEIRASVRLTAAHANFQHMNWPSFGRTAQGGGPIQRASANHHCASFFFLPHTVSGPRFFHTPIWARSDFAKLFFFVPPPDVPPPGFGPFRFAIWARLHVDGNSGARRGRISIQIPGASSGGVARRANFHPNFPRLVGRRLGIHTQGYQNYRFRLPHT